MRTLLVAFAIAAAPTFALAVGGDSSKPPTSTNTTQQCSQGMIWNPQIKKCVAPQHSGMSDDQLYTAVRELSYDGQYLHALAVLDAMQDQRDDRVMTYRGFNHRMLGNRAVARAWYDRALDENPDNFLARSYLGQGMVADGNLPGARVQLAEIRARGGGGSWAEAALQKAIETGQIDSY